MKRQHLLILAAAFCLFAVFVILFWDYSIDDAFITFRYSRNLADGYGLVFNPGGDVVEGYSNFLWMLILALVSLAGLPIYLLAKILGVICTLTAGLVYFLVGRKLEIDLTALAGAGFLLAPVTAFWAVSGLELGLHAMLLALALYAYLCRSRFLWPLLALLVVSRPEGAALALIIPAAGMLFDRDSFNSNKAYYLIAAGCVVLTAAALTIFRLKVFGYPLPNTYYAKQYGVAWAGEKQLLKMLVSYAAVTVGFVAVAIRDFIKRDFRAFFIICIFVVLAQIAASASVDPVMNFHLRYLLPVLPLMLLVTLDGLSHVASPLMRYAACGVIALNLLIPAYDVQNTVARERKIWAAQEKMIGWMKTLPEGTTISMTDMGRIPFYADKTFYDLWGLTNSETAHQGYNHIREFSRMPDYFAFVGNVQDRTVKFLLWRDQAIGYQPLFQQLYQPLDYFVPEDMKVTEPGYYYFVYAKRPEADSLMQQYELMEYPTQ
jgi:hypothetical protein